MLAWDAETNPAVVGYALYYGPAAGNYTSRIDVGNVTSYTVSNLTEGATYHFAVTAYDASRTESPFSNDASATIPYSAPVANFSGSTTSGTAPLAMNFTSTSTGTITTYAWSFGDGTTSNLQNPSHTYAAAGVYTVALTVTGPGGSNTKTNNNYITVSSSPPIAAFNASPTSGGAPLTVNFTSTSTGSITTYGWSFGDGSTSVQQNPSHAYAAAGVYTVALTVTGPGGSNTQTNSNYITVSAAPVANFSGSPTSGGAPLTVNFTSTSTGSITTYAWSFGDGTTSSQQNPSHAYTAAGTYTVALTVTGPGGSNTRTSSNYITVSAPPVANFNGSPTSGGAPLTVNFTSMSNGTINSYAWSFGDGSTSNLQNPSHAYAAAGVYTVALTVTGPGGSNTQTNSNYITVSAAPVANFSGGPTTGAAPLTVNFTSSSTGTITTYAWSFGDGTTSNLQNPSHAYAAAGVYTVALTVTGPGGSNTQTNSNYITVSAAAPAAAFSGSPTTGSAPLTVNFANTSTGAITTYAWSFGDGATSNLQNPSHAYAASGTYTVALTVTGPGGSNTQTSSNYITVSAAPPVAAFSATPTSGGAPLNVNFTSTSTGSISTYAWSFGDGTTSNLQNPGHAYGAAGTYSVALTVTGPGGSNTKMNAGYVVVSSSSGGHQKGGGGGGSQSFSIWPNTAAPISTASTDTSAVELGIKFKSDRDGSITGIEFYKAPTNTGTHVASLWSSDGTLLARATFKRESRSGWQQVTFSKPVAITANTVYVASYHTNVGHYYSDSGYFTASGVDNAPLHALQDGVSGSNGVLGVSATPSFPSSGLGGTNYWVDVIFK